MALAAGEPPAPPLGAAELPLEDDGALSLDEQFSQVLYALMRDDVSAATAIQALQQTSAAAAQQYREASSALLHRAAHYLHTRRLASELEAQAASWQLLHVLYCSGYEPAGSALAGAADVAGRQTLRQATAELVNSDDGLRRCAHVVMWLESLAAQRLSQAPAARFAQHEGLWRETLLTSGGAGFKGLPGSSTSVELDPDAPGRGKLRLAPGDKQGEERLVAQLWQLIRAGKVKEGRQLCCQAGQAWRSLSLAGGGDWGPLPVGEPAADATEALDQQDAAAELSWQVEGGVAAGRVAWKWACYAAAEAAATATPGNRWEAAVYGALCGHVRRMLPVCASWEDEAWSYCRAWLDLKADALLLEGCQSDAGQQQALMGAGSTPDDAEVDLLSGCVALAARSSYSSSTDMQLLRDGLSVLQGNWPLQTLLSEGDRVCVPRDFTELAQLLSSSPNPAVRNASSAQQHVLQLLTMAEDWTSLTLELTAAALSAAEQLQALAQGGGAGGAASGADGASDAGVDDDSVSVASLGGGMAGGPAGEDEGLHSMSVESAAGALRFAAHWALSLRALGLLPDHSWLRDEAEEAEVARLQAMLSKVIHQHALVLASQPESLCLVPLYLCHLRLGLRESLAQTLLAHATDVGDDEACQALYMQLVAATEAWAERQQRLSALVLEGGKAPGPWWQVDEGGGDDDAAAADGDAVMGEGSERVREPSSCLFGDLRPQEVRLLLQQMVSRSFASSATSPLQRCRQLRWMFYAFTGALAAAAEAAAPGGDGAAAAAAAAPPVDPAALAWQDGWGDALSNALSLAAEMALNPGLASAGLAALVGQVVPPAFTPLASAVAAQQLAAAPLLQVQRQLLALAFWLRYQALDARYQAWKANWAAALAAAAADDGGDAVAAAAEAGHALAADLLGLASEDCLRLPAPPQLVSMVLDAAGGPAAAAAAGCLVEDSEWLALPKHDSDDDTPTAVQLALTLAQGGPAAAANGAAAADGDGGDPDAPFLQLQAREAGALQQALQGFLAAATASTPDVSFETDVADAGSDLSGCVLVRLTSYSERADGAAPDADRARLQRRMLAAWRDMVALAALLLGGGGGGGGGSGLPRLALVHLQASLSTQLSMCRARTTSKLLRRTAKVLLALARAGHPSQQLDALISAASDGGGRAGPQLLGQLSPRDAARLLSDLELILEECGGPDDDLLLA